MPDIEKVIKALECRKNAHKRCGNPCEETGTCHYATAVRDINGEIYRPFICDRERICTDALALLKEQEAKEQDEIESINFGDRTDIMANLEGLTWDDWRMYHSDTEVQNIAKSAFDLLITLLKEQEAVTVHDPGAFCPKCGWMLYPEDHPKFCGNCGQAVKWND